MRYSYTSLTTPETIYEVNHINKERRLLKESPVLGGFDKNNYLTERLWAPARDRTLIPVSVVYRKGFIKNGTAALLQYGYGAMAPARNPGSTPAASACSIEAWSTPSRMCAVGRRWAGSGTRMGNFKEENTFTDFVMSPNTVNQGTATRSCSGKTKRCRWFVDGRYCQHGAISFGSIVSEVPFIDNDQHHGSGPFH